MVGVPQQDRGCERCRKLRKGCDRARPSCSQCRKQGIDCNYEARKWRFIPITGAKDIGLATSSPPIDSSARKPSKTPGITLNDKLAASARAIAIVDEFWSLYLPKDKEGTLIEGLPSVPWAVHLQGHALQEAVQACAFMLLGDSKHNKDCARVGQKFYVSGLRKLNERLQDPKQMDVNAAIATCKVMSMYEHLRRDEEGNKQPGTQVTDWIRHIKGVCQIMELRSNELIDTRDGFALHENLHLNLTTVNIIARRRILHFNAWPKAPKNESLRADLLPIMDDLPLAFEAHDQLLGILTSPDESGKAYPVNLQGSLLLGRLQRIARRLEQWERRVLAVVRRYGGQHSTLITCCAMYNQGFLYTVALYWTACLLTSATAVAALKLCGDYSGCQWPVETAKTWLNPRNFARLIAEHIKYFYSADSGIWCQEAVTFPIGMVRRYCYAFDLPRSEEMRMMADAIEQSTLSENTNAFLRSAAARAPSQVSSEIEAQFTYSAKKWYGLLEEVDRSPRS